MMGLINMVSHGRNNLQDIISYLIWVNSRLDLIFYQCREKTVSPDKAIPFSFHNAGQPISHH